MFESFFFRPITPRTDSKPYTKILKHHMTKLDTSLKGGQKSNFTLSWTKLRQLMLSAVGDSKEFPDALYAFFIPCE